LDSFRLSFVRIYILRVDRAVPKQAATADDNGPKPQTQNINPSPATSKRSILHRSFTLFKRSTMLGVSGLRTFRAVTRRGLPSSDCVVSSQSRFATDSEKPKQKTSKVKKKAKSVKEDSARSKDLDLVMASLDAPSREESPISEEEKARRYQIGRNYVIGRFRRHNEIEHDLTCKMQMKKHAMKMLPKDTKLKEEALKVDADDPPLWRNLAMWTAPIKDFDPSQFIESDD
jgi:hypothetical protein